MAKSKKKQKRVGIKSIIWRRRLVPIIGILLFAGVGTYLLQSLFAAAPPLTFSLYATHPYASKAGFDSTSTNYYTGAKLCATEFCPTGQTITDMEISAEGQLVAGYGEWTANVDSFGVSEGRVGVVPLDINTNTWGTITVAGSEALDTFRKINGKIYAPTTDPSDTLGSKSGYITNESGSWELKHDNMQVVHTFDIATSNGTDRMQMGTGQGQATAYRSVNNDGNWSKIATGATDDWARWYWAGTAGGKLFMGSIANNTVYGTAGTQVFDGTNWTKVNVEPCYTSKAKMVVSYENKILCPSATYNVMNVFDGTSVKTMSINQSIRDFYVDGTKLYLLTASGGIFEYTSLNASPVQVGQASTNAQTVAVYNGYLYVGATAGQIYRSNGVIGSGTTPTPTPGTNTMTVSSVAPSSIQLDRSKQIVTIDGTNFPAGVSVKIGGQTTSVMSSTGTQLKVEFDTGKYIRQQRLRTTSTRTLAVEVLATGYVTVTAPSITATYTK